MNWRGWQRTGIGAAALLLCVPLLVVITGPLHTAAPEWSHVRNDLLPSYLLETTGLLAATLTLALLFGVSSAWLIAGFDFPLRNKFRWLLVLPLACPTYIAAFVYAALLGPTGSWSIWINDHLGFRPDVMHLPGLATVLALVLFPYIHLPVRAVFSGGMSAHLDAARTLGASDRSRFFNVALPLARPAIAAGAVLVAMETLNDYGAVKYYNIHTLTTGIFRSWGGLYDMGSALRLGGMLLLLAALLLWIERRARRGARQEVDQAPVLRKRLVGRRAFLATAWCWLLVVAGVIVPWWKLSIDSLATWRSMDLLPLFGAALRTLGLANIAAVVTIGCAILFLFAQRHRLLPDGLVRAAHLGYVVPGAVIAVGTMAAAGAIDRAQVLPFTFIGGMALLVYAFAIRFLAVAGQPLQGAISQQSRSLDDAARLLGASPWKTFRTVNLPLLRPALLAAAMLVAVDVVKELPLTMILRPFDMDTLSTKAFELARIEQLREASLPALMIVFCATLPVLLLDRLAARRER